MNYHLLWLNTQKRKGKQNLSIICSNSFEVPNPILSPIKIHTQLNNFIFSYNGVLFFHRSIGHFATNVCAIVGGIFTVAGIIDTLVYHSLNAIHNKMVLGKTGWKLNSF